jgi:metal-sulfur cluster biosynthetic enzyme
VTGAGERPAAGERAAVRLRSALDRVCDPCSITAGAVLSIVDMGLVRRQHVTADGALEVTVGVTGPGCTYVGLILEAVEREVRADFGDDVRLTVAVDTAWVWTEADLSPAARAVLAARRRRTVVDLGLRPRMWEEAGAA